MSKLSLCVIAKNEEKTLPRLLDSVAQFVDEIVVVDTGSMDRTKQNAADRGARVFDCNPMTHHQFFFIDDEKTGAPGPYSNGWCLGDFAAVRNFSFEQSTGDYILWLDCDDVLINGVLLPRVVDDMIARGMESAWFQYHYGSDDKGRVTCHLWRERIIKRGIASWMNPIHEVLVPLRGDRVIRVPDVIVQHHRPSDRAAVVANRNYKVLLQELKRKPDDARTLFYLGNEAKFIEPPKAIEAYERYVDLSGWAEERSMARIFLAELYLQRGMLSKAYANYAAATMDLPNFPDGWFGLAQVAYAKQEWSEVVRFSDEGFKRGQPESVIMINPMRRAYEPHLYYNVALNKLGRVDDALRSVEAGLQVVPEDTNLQHNRNVYRAYLDSQTDPVQLALKSDRTPAHVKAAISKALADATPPPPPLLKLGPQAADKLSIVVWTGPAVEWWSPNSPKMTGIGGSETACIEMCKNLAALGHKVIVFSDCPHMDGTYDGVEYRHFGGFGGVDCDVFISSRQPSVAEHEIRAKLKLLWVHDIHVGQAHPKLHEYLLKFDRFLCLSEWHKNFFLHEYKFLHPSSVVVTRNGIDPSRFAGELPPKKNRCVFSSSANRGLDQMLNVWPRIREQVTDAELHVYYGFESWANSARICGNTAELQQIEDYKRRLAETPAVVFHGRVNQETLAKEMMVAKLWTYPTAFTETYGIGAIEAQAAGCVPVTSDLAGLSTTVTDGVLLGGHNADPLYHDAFVRETVRLLRDEETRAKMADKGRKHALTLSWVALAADWDAMFRRCIDEVAEAMVPAYEQMKGKEAA